MALLEKPAATVGATIGLGSSPAPDSLYVHASFLPSEVPSPVALLQKPSATMGWPFVRAFPLLLNQHADFCRRCRAEGFSSDASSLSFSVDGFPVGASFSGAAALGERLRLFLPVMLESLWVLYLSRWSGP